MRVFFTNLPPFDTKKSWFQEKRGEETLLERHTPAAIFNNRPPGLKLPAVSVRLGSYRSGTIRWRMAPGRDDTLWSSSWWSSSGWRCSPHTTLHRDLKTHTFQTSHTFSLIQNQQFRSWLFKQAMHLEKSLIFWSLVLHQIVRSGPGSPEPSH